MFRKSKLVDNKLDSSLNMNLLDVESQVLISYYLIQYHLILNYYLNS
jgi:hypothetical protein